MRGLLLLLAVLSSSCGGGSGGSVGPPGPSPSLTVLSGNIVRTVVTGTSVSIAVLVSPVNYQSSGDLYSSASDPTGVFSPTVAVTGNADGSYTLTAATLSAVATGQYSGNLKLTLCSDLACDKPLAAASAEVPFNISELSPASAWPGNNLTPLTAWTGAPDWTMFQGNAAHTGYVPVTIDPDQIVNRWQQLQSTVQSDFLPVVPSFATSGGQIFVAGNDLHLYVIKEFDGSAVWQHDFNTLMFPSVNPPAVAGGVVYVSAGQQSSTSMFALNATDGSLIFQSQMASQFETYLAPAIGAQGIYSDGGTYGGLYGFSPTGTQLFIANEAQTSLWTPAVDSAGVYSYTGGVLQQVDPVSGAALNSIVDPTFANYTYVIEGSPVLGAPGSVFAANYANNTFAESRTGNTLLDFDLNNSTIAWSVSGFYATSPAYSAGVLYATNNSPLQLEARAEAGGAMLWSWAPPQAGDAQFISEVLLTNELVFVSTTLATYAIDTTSHLTVWSYPLSGKLGLSQNGILYIEGTDILSAFNVK